MKRLLLGAAGAAALLLPAAPLRAQSPGSNELTLGGYLRSITAAQDLGYDPPLSQRRSAFHGDVLRLKWSARVANRLRVSVHDRVQVQLTSAARALGTGVTGFGVSAVPDRTVSLETNVIDWQRVRVWHDLDRLAVNLYTGAVDLTVGRQAVSWGIANLFPVADLWAQFSPFELDTEEKRGVDAFRALTYPAPGVELDLVVADRGSLRDLSAGARATVGLSWADVYVAGGKFWREVIGLAGIAAVAGTWKLRAEVALPWDLDGTEVRAPRMTLGVDRLRAKAQLSVEYHYNGLGATDAAGYLARLTSAEVRRGQTYFLGRHYLGALASHLPTDRLTLSVSVLGNLQDPSASLSPAVTYDLGQRVRLAAGGLIAAGKSPRLALPNPSLRSEYGTYGRLGYVTAAVYF